MFEEDLPPPYSLEDEQRRNSIPQPPIVHSEPSISSTSLGLPPAFESDSNTLRPISGAGQSSSISLPSPAYSRGTFPSTTLDLSTFKSVTTKVKRQLVALEDIETHLRLLRAFQLFKGKVEGPYSDPRVAEILPSVGRGIGANGRWLWFLEMAVERFRRWAMLLATSEGFFVIPPVDVWLVWHTYMLNPTWYMEDCERLWLLRPLKRLGEHPMQLAASVGDNILDYQPTGDQEGIWEAGTRLPFDPFDSSATLLNQDIECPKCAQQISISFVNVEGTGFAQADFVTVCPRCNTLITREALGVAKFIKDIILDPNDSAHFEMHGKGVYLPGTLLTPSGNFQIFSAARLKSNIRHLGVFRKANATNAPNPQGVDAWTRAIGERLGYSSTELRKNLEKVAGMKDRMVRRIMGAYVDGKPFSVELVAAATRQSTFVDKIHELGWLDPGFFGDSKNAQVLHHCIFRYYGFLTLIKTDPDSKSFFVPTLDVDLVWHTHQLAPVYYSKDCRSIFSRLIDHDDQVEENNLAVGLDSTSKAWRDKFGVPYMHCGCPSEETTVGQRLARASSSMLSTRHCMQPPMSRDDCYAATHPSDHNSVFIKGRSAWRRELRQVEWERRRVQEGKKVEKGKFWGKDAELEERYSRGQSHEYPFLSSAAKTPGYGCPRVQQAYAGSCAAGVSGCAAHRGP